MPSVDRGRGAKGREGALVWSGLDGSSDERADNGSQLPDDRELLVRDPQSG